MTEVESDYTDLSAQPIRHASRAVCEVICVDALLNAMANILSSAPCDSSVNQPQRRHLTYDCGCLVAVLQDLPAAARGDVYQVMKVDDC